MTAVQPDPALPARRGSPLAVRFAVAFLAGLALVIAIGGGALYAYGQQYTGRVLPGVRVGQVDLSGLAPDQARAALKQAYGTLAAGAVTLRGPDRTTTIGYADIDRRPDVDGMVAEAMAAGRRGEPVADLIGAPQAALRGVALTPTVTYDPAKLAAAVATAANAIDRAPVDATLTAVKGDFALTESVDGRLVDQAALLQAIDARITPLDAPVAVALDIPYAIQKPALDTAEATAAKQAAERMTADLVLRRGDAAWTIAGATLRPLVSFTQAPDGTVTPVVDQAGLGALIKPIARDIDAPAANATFRIKSGRVVVGKASRDGATLDRAATQALLVQALAARQAGQAEPPLTPVVLVKAPSVTTEYAKQVAPKMREISRWTTKFPIWSHNAFGANIWIPASIIDGTVVGPGETFDFWKVVGAVTRARGYGLGGAIINGRTQAQGAIGGGICSTSTTLFNAALRAGYQMGARRNHFYYIDRYPVGLDATVFISSGGQKQTMSWTNDTAYPVLIRGINSRSGNTGYVTFRLYSLPTNRTVSISAPTIKNIRKATDSTEPSATLRAGYTGRVESPVDGMDVWRTITVREAGRVIRKTTYYSHYGVVTGVVLIGTGGPSAPTKVP